ncbi:MAG: acyl-CoA dehydrogenase family protein [Bacteroidota bacterium]
MNSLLLNTLESKRGDTLEDIQDQLNKAEKNKDYLAFYDYLKTTKFPFIPCNERNTQMVYDACFKTLHAIGEVSIPVAVALSMHYYVLASMASYPFSKTSKEYWKREMLLHQIKKEGLIIANTGSVRTYTNVSEHKGVTVQRKDGKYLVNGKTPFMSLAGVADYLVFTAELSQGKKAVFFVPSNSEGIYFQDSVFGETMEGSFTKAVSFKDLEVSNAHVLTLDTSEETKCELLIYQRSWFQALVPAPYLGAARRVIEDLNSFGRQKLKNGKKLAESESFLQGMGELQMKYKAAYHSCIHAGRVIAGFKKGDKVNLEHIFEASVLAKYFSTHFSEDIVTGARQLMGSRFLAPDSHTNKIYKEIVFGALQPMTDGDIKDYFGRALFVGDV